MAKKKPMADWERRAKQVTLLDRCIYAFMGWLSTLLFIMVCGAWFINPFYLVFFGGLCGLFVGFVAFIAPHQAMETLQDTWDNFMR